ncbi:MAG: DUF4097 family beta strand repeat-containing protein [Candidatus Bipolaricaulota bacterium]|nr:DUF4097 family beta strand repeat-containing protein [Candidatus Bipolaricaulota bacterium]
MHRRKFERIGLMILVAAGALLLLGCDLEDLEAPRVESTNTEQSTFAVAGRTTLVIETTNGDVTVQGVTGQTQVQVTTTLRSRGDTLAEANRRLGQLTVVRAQEGDRITLRYRADDQPEDVRRSSAVDFAVTVPLDTDASVAGTNGKLTAESLRGTLALETTNGEVTLSNVAGSVTARTINGSVDVRSSQGALRLETTNGEVRMAAVEASVDVETTNGSVHFAGRLVGTSHSMRTTNGSVTVAIQRESPLLIDARTSTIGSIRTDLPLVGDTEGKAWSATLNPPATATLTLRTTNGAIRIEALK